MAATHPPGTFDERWAAAWDRRRIDADEALEAAAELRAAVTDGDEESLGRVLLLEGSCRWRRSDYLAALRCLTGALDLLPRHRRHERAFAMLDLGTVHNYAGLYDQALEHTLAALRLFEDIRDDTGRGDASNNLGIIFYHRGELAEAKRAYQDSADLREQLDDAEGLAGCRNNLAKVLTDEGAYDDALQELDLARRTWDGSGNLRGLGMVHNNTGIVHHRRGDLDTAARWFRSSLSLKSRIGDRHGACETRTHLARVRAAQGRSTEAVELLELAVADAEELGIHGELAEACLALSEMLEADGDHAAALAWYRRYHNADRTRFNDRSEQRLQVLQITYRLARAEQEGATDGLTGLANRRSLDRRLREHCSRVRRDGTPLTVALLDLDGFKLINDTFGHAVGDEVLRTVAGIIREHTRASDLPARYGGEEFAVILPGARLPEAEQAAQQLRQRIRSHPWERVHPDLEVTVSIGLATADDAADAAAMLALADHHLYLAKHGGKDRVEAQRPGTSVPGHR